VYVGGLRVLQTRDRSQLGPFDPQIERSHIRPVMYELSPPAMLEDTGTPPLRPSAP